MKSMGSHRADTENVPGVLGFERGPSVPQGEMFNSRPPTQSNYEIGAESRALFNVEDIILLGRSIGTGIAAELAAYACESLGRKPAALVLVSAFESLR